MPETGGQERTEKATPKRRRDARKKGQVAQSRELSSVMILMTALGFFYLDIRQPFTGYRRSLWAS
jgi:flagellar biosynthetic protein FlhB